MNAQPHLRGLFISTHALTEGDGLDVVEEYNFEISTHALTEGDALRSS